MELITGIAWQCVFPIKVGGIALGPVGPDGPAPNSDIRAICHCNNGPVPKVGVGISLSEPARIFDTVADPFCLMPVGTQISAPGGKLGGALVTQNGSTRAFAQVHAYIFPAWSMLDLFQDVPCINESPFSVLFFTEFMPTWNNEFLAMLVNPESVLFANPAAALSCAPDSLAALAGFPLNTLFWCMGSWGNAYPLAGSITAPDYVTANAGLAARATFLMGRMGLLREFDYSGCYSSYTPIWSKDRYRFQSIKPVRDSSCQPVGRTGLLWSQMKHPPAGGDNFMWMQFRRLNCCVTY